MSRLSLWLVTVAAASLKPPRWQRLPTGHVQPRGWLKAQMSLQAGALTSHLPLFWPNVANSSWIGGFADVDGGLHENTPYWLNGAVPLAVQLEDEGLLAVVKRYMDSIFTRQSASGWLGPDTDPSDFWSRMPFLLALTQYHEAMPFEQSRCEAVAKRFFEELQRRLQRGLMFDNSWTSMRAHDLIWSIHYFADHMGDGLLALAKELHEKAFQWNTWFNGSFPEEAVAVATMSTHGVNNAQAVKAGVVWGRQSDAAAGFAESWLAWSQLRRFHGQVHGAFGADEHLAGRMPSRGTELCVVVEAMWSLALLAQLAPSDVEALEALDALERLAFNALPGSLSRDLWSHPYLQMANGFQALSDEPDHIWTHDGPESAMYGLEPQYPCCTANFHQGYPKFTANLFFHSERHVISGIWAPSMMRRKGLTIELKTSYPFGSRVEYAISNEEPFVLKIRLPKFLREDLSSLELRTEGQVMEPRLRQGFLNLAIEAGARRVAVRLDFDVVPKVVDSKEGRSVLLGPLVMALDLKEQRRLVRRHAFEAADWDTVATEDWRLGLQEARLGFVHWSGRCPRLVAELVELSAAQWPVAHAAPGPPRTVRGGLRTVNRTLVAYGCTSIRIAVFPKVMAETRWV